VALASIVEKETGRPEERPRISCVFHNRLKKKMRLQTDPTVVYALLLSHDFKWDHNIHKDDLSLQHPYNTYFIKGCLRPDRQPGQAALEAALHPVACDDLFFVSRNDHTHVFCPDLKCHERTCASSRSTTSAGGAGDGRQLLAGGGGCATAVHGRVGCTAARHRTKARGTRSDPP